MAITDRARHVVRRILLTAFAVAAVLGIMMPSVAFAPAANASSTFAPSTESVPAQPAPPAQTDEPNQLERLNPAVAQVTITWTAYYQPRQSSPDTTAPTAPNFVPTKPQTPKQLVVQGFCSASLVGTSGELLSNGHCYDEEEAAQALLSQIDSGSSSFGSPTAPQMAQTPTKDDLSDITMRVQFIQDPELPNSTFKRPTDGHLVARQTMEQGDLALLKVDDLGPNLALTVACDMPRDEDATVRSIGYAGNLLMNAIRPEVKVDSENPFGSFNADDPSRTAQDIFHARIRPSFKSGTLNGEQYVDGVRFTEVNAELTPGMSGGPTVAKQPDGTYALLGTNSFITDVQSFNFVTGLDNVKSFLDGNGVKYATNCPTNGNDTQSTDIAPRANASQDGGSDWLGYILVGAIGIVIGIIATMLVNSVRRQSGSAAAQKQTPTTGDDTDTMEKTV